MPSILITDGFAENAVSILKEANGLNVDLRKKTPRDELLETLPEVEAVVIRSATTLDREAIDAAPRLKLIVRAGAGVDNIDLNAAKEKGITVMNTPGANNNAVAELTIGFLLALYRLIPRADQTMKNGLWEKNALKGREVQGATLGILGLGKIGMLVAEKALGLGMKIRAFDPVLKESPRSDIELVSRLEDAIRGTDAVTIHVPKIKPTENLINEKVFAEMKHGAVLLHCARGGIVDEKAALAALESGKLSGAAFDVYTEEPPAADHPVLSKLIRHPNFIASPHIGASTREAQENVSLMAARQLIDFFLEGKKTNVVE